MVGTPKSTTITKPITVRGIGSTPIDGMKAISRPYVPSLQKLRNGASQSPFLSLCGLHASNRMKTMNSIATQPMTWTHALSGPKAIKAARAMLARTSGKNQKKWKRGRYWR